MSRRKPHIPAVVVLGDITIDILAPIQAFPKPGEDCLSPALELHLGGVAANTAVALARWGVAVRLLGCVGRDAFGDLALDSLRRAGLDVSRVQRTDRAATGLMFIAVHPDGQRTIFGARGANAEVKPSRRARYLSGAQAAHLLGYNLLSASTAKVAEQVLSEAREGGRLVSLDVGMAPSQQIPEKILQLARKVDILFVGREEALALTGERNNRRAFAALRSQGAREVVMKLGEHGCRFEENGATREAPPFLLKAADTTGAGDAFAAAFLWARLRGWPKAQGALLANAAGAAAARVVGAGEAMPGPQQIVRLLRRTRLSAEWDAARARVVERLRAAFGSKGSRRSPRGSK